MNLLHPNLRARLVLASLCGSLLLTACTGDSPEALIASGKALVAKNDNRGAALQFKSALQLAPENAEVRLLLGRSLLASGDPLSAGVELTKALEQGRPKDEIVPLLARAQLATGDFKKIVLLHDKTELNDPAAQASLKTTLAAAWAGLGDKTRADAALAAALAAAPNHGPALVLRARALVGQGDLNGALALIDKVLALTPNDPEAWQAKGEMLAFGRKDSKAGAEAMKKALAIDPTYVQPYGGLVAIAVRAKDLAAARAVVEQLRSVLPDHIATAFLDAQIALFDNKLDIARERILAVLRVAPDDASVLQLAGLIEGQSGSFVMAESHFSKALQINPKLLMARRSLGLTLLKTGQYARVLDVVKPLITGDQPDGQALALAGDAALRLGDARAAEAYFQRSAKANPDDTGVNTALAMAHLARGDAGRTFGDLDKLSRDTPDQTVADMAIISARIGRGEWDEALTAITVADKKSPDNTQLLELRGRINMARGNLGAARQAFERALAIQPGFFGAITNLTVVDMMEKKPEQAAARLRDAFKADPRNFLAALALTELRRNAGAPLSEQQAILLDAIKGNPGEAQPRLALIELDLRNKRLKEALQVAQDAGSALPNDVRVLAALAGVQTQNGDTQQAISTYKRLTNIDPKNTAPLMSLASLYRSNGDRANAEAHWRRVLDVDPRNAAVPSLIVESMLAGRKPAEALAEAAAMQQRPADSVLGFLLEGTVHQRAKNQDKAIAAFSNGLKRAPHSADLSIRLHQALNAAGRGAEAERLRATWLKDNPNDDDFELELANGQIIAGNLPAAEKILRALLARHPQSALPLNNLAWVLATQRKPGGVDLAQRAIANGKESATMLDTLALALSVEGQSARALEVQKRAVALAPQEASLRLGLARLAAAAGDKALARVEIEALSASNQSEYVRAEAAKLLKSL